MSRARIRKKKFTRLLDGLGISRSLAFIRGKPKRLSFKEYVGLSFGIMWEQAKRRIELDSWYKEIYASSITETIPDSMVLQNQIRFNKETP